MKACWLHVSDFHFRDGESYEREVILQALVESVARFRRKNRKPDLVFATGDIGNSGKPGEYTLATEFFDRLLAAAGLSRDRLFVVPGNHDCDRSGGDWLLRTLETREQADRYFAPGVEKLHLVKKQMAFSDWYDTYFASTGRKFPRDSTCGPIETVTAGDWRIAVLPLNSALFSQDDADHAKLWIGRRSLEAALNALDAEGADLRVALLHHPLSSLSDVERAAIKTLLQERVDFILRGHLHENDLEQIMTASGGALHFAAGATYQTMRWPNRALYVTLDASGATVFPIRYEDVPKRIWVVDPGLFPDDPGFEHRFAIPRLNAPALAPELSMPTALIQHAVRSFPSNIPVRGSNPFIGRDELLQQMGELLPDPSAPNIVVLHGPPGVGKTEAAREYARRNRERYPMGTFLIDASQGAEWIDLARIGANTFNLDFAATLSLHDQCERTLAHLAAQPGAVLLIYDNIDDLDSAQPWLPRVGMHCHIIATTCREPRETNWPLLLVSPLDMPTSLRLIESVGGTLITAEVRRALAEHAQGLPVQLVPAAMTLVYQARRGYDASSPSLNTKAANSIQVVYGRLQREDRLLLHAAAFLNSQRVLREELAEHLLHGAGWSPEQFSQCLDNCQDLHLLRGVGDLRMHQLLTEFLLQQRLPSSEQQLLKKIREKQRERFLELAGALAQTPTRTDLAASLLVFPLHHDAWESAGVGIDPVAGERCGHALREIGKFQWAQPWYERAVQAKRSGSVAGAAFDHLSLGFSLNDVGLCLSNSGQFAEADGWYRQAVESKRRGNAQGRIDHESIGVSLHQIGFCQSKLGNFEAARPWFEEAVEVKRKGDLDGRVDHASIGASLHGIGYCLSAAKQRIDARQFYERAVDEMKLGDVNGRVDHADMGMTLHLIGVSLSEDGAFEEAQVWCEQAVEAARIGHLDGRIDYQNLGTSLHLVGHCLLRRGKFEAARSWYEQAVEVTERGDIHGRVNYDHLGASLYKVADCLSGMDDHSGALPWYERAVTATKRGDIHGRVNEESLRIQRAGLAACQARLTAAGAPD